MTYKDAFSDYDNAVNFERMLASLAYHGYVDGSWKNDLCPCLIKAMPNGAQIRVWIDYRARDQRDIQSHEISITAHNADGDAFKSWQFKMYETSHVANLAAALAAHYFSD